MNQIKFFVLFAFLLFVNLPAQNLTVPDTIRICAIRVEFQEDDNDLTTGNGKFMVDSVTTDPYAIDPAPHNKLYFQDQIRAASNYFHRVSNGRITVNGDVFPGDANGAYQLGNPMGYYNPNTTDAEINLGISQLFTDAVTAADQDDQIRFADYDLVIVFHAGVGRDIALDFDPTPQDIASLFITHDFLKTSFGGDYAGVPADDGFVTQGILLPETENQEGEMIALTGIFVSNIGTYLGLYDLFSPTKQRSGVGRFDLMDVGLLNLNGLIPSPPGAFSRMLLGWDTPVTVDQPQSQIQIANLAMENPTAPTSIKIPINDDEYYLLEHRGDPEVDMDQLFIDLLEDRTEFPSYLELLKTHFADQIEIGESGVLLSVPDYDWGLPGSGILIWHIDERIIREKGPANRLNDDPNLRAVDIEEADGSQDIGQLYSFLEPGYQTELGTLADFWFSNRPDYLENFELYENKFATNTAPNTRANLNNAISHITLENFSANTSDIMTFDYKRDVYEPGFPVRFTDHPAKIESIVSGPVQNKDADFAFIADVMGQIFAVGAQGSMASGLFVSDSFKIGSISATGPVSSLALIDSDMNPGNDLLIAASGKSIRAFDLTSEDDATPGRARVDFTVLLEKEIISPAVCSGGLIYVTCEDLTGYEIDVNDPQNFKTFTTSSVQRDIVAGDQAYFDIADEIDFVLLAHLRNADALDLIIYNNDFQSFIFFDENKNEHFNFKAPVPLKSQFALADLDGNATLDIIFNSTDRIYAYNQKGYPLSGFPIKPEFGTPDSLTGTPLLVDLDGSGIPEIIVITGAGQVLTFTEKGKPLTNYRLSTGGSLSSTPVILQLDADSEMELLAATDQGNLYAWQLAGSDVSAKYWFSENYDASNNVLIQSFSAYSPVSNALMPERRVYNYPNPNQDNYTKIRYYLNDNSDVKIRIFDASGLLIDEFNGPGQGQVDNEIPWDVSSVASGVYLCKIEAKSGSRTESKIIKIMVVH